MNRAASFPIAEGDAAMQTRAFDAEDVAAYRELSGDRGLGFGPGDRDAVPGPLLAAMISDLLGTTLPGLGTMWLKQRLSYPGSAPVGATVTATVRVTRLRPEKDLVDLETICRCGGEPVLAGEALVMVPGLAARTAG
jgi:acyl dehydratase